MKWDEKCNTIWAWNTWINAFKQLIPRVDFVSYFFKNKWKNNFWKFLHYTLNCTQEKWILSSAMVILTYFCILSQDKTGMFRNWCETKLKYYKIIFQIMNKNGVEIHFLYEIKNISLKYYNEIWNVFNCSLFMKICKDFDLFGITIMMTTKE